MEEDPPQRVKLTKAQKKEKYRKDIPEPIKSRRECLKSVMNGREEDREQNVRRLNFNYFDEDYRSQPPVNMYARAVDTLKAMPDKGKTGGQCLAEWYLKDFDSWLKEKAGREEQLRNEFLTPNVQGEALKACTVNQKALLCRVFDISQERLIEDMTELLSAAVQKQDYSNAAEYALQYNLAHKHSFEELALPLLLSGKEQLAYKLLEGQVEMQKELVKFLDSMSGASITTVEKILEPYKMKNIMTVQTERFSGKTLDKLIQTVIVRNVNDYNFDPNLAKYAPKHSVHGISKNLKYNINERYNNGRSDDVYFQHMVDGFKDCPSVREETLYWLWDSNDYQKQVDAISLAMHFGFDHSSSTHLPGKMKDFFRAPDSRMKEAEELLKTRKTMQTPGSNEVLYVNEEEKQYPIIIVKSESDLNNLCSQLNALSKSPDQAYVGFDSEWKPTNVTSNKQLFFADKVWLVDVVELGNANVSDDWWQKFAVKLFIDNKFRIIGFDMRNDLDAMLTIPALKNFLKIEKINNCFDLKRLAENICDVDMEILELPKKTFKLADLTLHFLNVTLDKTEQCSNWQCRPLRKNQIIYAALDAVVVVDTFRKIMEITLERDSSIDMANIVNNSNVLAPKKEKSSKTVRKLKTIPWKEIYETLRHHRDTRKPLQKPHEIQVIVDTMLLGFGKHLRRCGIDVYLPRDVSDFRAKLKLISRLGGDFKRHIITVPSKSYDALKQDYEKFVIALPDLNSKPPMDQLTAFFDIFNIDIRPEDEYLRCIECNSRLQIKFPGPVLHFLHQYSVIFLQNVYRPDMSEFKRQTAIHNNLPEGVEVRIHKVPDDEFQRPNICFYVCGDCGAVANDGHLPPNSASNESVL
ncbi:CBN-MUT-7 protein [Caenorhabditis brenneri]|uniref:CBN-MUT-7 protein n=1 Tax=Caenorhabditis brenneri TaxID=135651 RepID=G0MK52_CAEBE|nr:CBN-MUT-7 protein [Caenorhabditis brenneri]